MHTFKNNVYLSHCFTYDSFIEIWLTYKIHPFKVHSSLVFVYSELCSHRYNLILEHFISPESKPVPISCYSTFPEGRTWQKLTRLAPVFWVQTCPTGHWPLRTSGEYHLAHRKPSQTPQGDRPFKPRSGGPFRVEKARHVGSKGHADLRLPMGPQQAWDLSKAASQWVRDDGNECIETCLAAGSDIPGKLYVLSIVGMFVVPPEVSDLRPDHRLKLYLTSNTGSNRVTD